MQTSSIVIHAFGFAAGFFWVCIQKEVGRSQIWRSLLAGAVVAAAAYVGARLFAPTSLLANPLALPLSGLVGATVTLWIQARELLAQKMGQDSVLMLTISYAYFFSPLQGGLKTIGYFSLLPCALTVFMIMRKKTVGENGRVGLMFWAMIVSLTMGVYQLMSSPESLWPSGKGTWMTNLPSFYATMLLAAGLITLAFNLVPFVEWARESLFGNPHAGGQRVDEDQMGPKKMFYLALFHAAPLILNWKFRYFSYDAMLSYSLVWSPMLSHACVRALFPNLRSELPGWNPEINRAS